MTGGCTALFDAGGFQLEVVDAGPHDVAPELDGSSDSSAADSPSEVAPGGLHVVLPGGGACDVWFEQPLLQCPNACPDSSGWVVTFDASATAGVGSWAWNITGESGLEVAAQGAWNGAVASAVVTTDSNALGLACNSTVEIPKKKLFAFVSMDGGPEVQAGTVTLTFRPADAATCSSKPMCGP